MTAAPTQTPTRPRAPRGAPAASPTPATVAAAAAAAAARVTVDPRDRARLEDAPVRLGRVLALFGPYRRPHRCRRRDHRRDEHRRARPAVPRPRGRRRRHPAAGRAPAPPRRRRHGRGRRRHQLLGVLQTWLSTQVGQRVMHALRTRVFTHLQRQSLGFFTRTRGGEVQSRLVNDVGGMQGVVTSTATSIASNVTTAVATAVAMVALLLAALAALPARRPAGPLADPPGRPDAPRGHRPAAAPPRRPQRADRGGPLGQRGRGWPRPSAPATARPSGSPRTSQDLVGLELRSQLAGRWRMATMQIVFAVIPALVYLAAGLPATAGGMTIGTLVAFTALQGGIFRPLMGLLNVTAQWVASMALFSPRLRVPRPRARRAGPGPPGARWTRARVAGTCGSRTSPCATRARTRDAVAGRRRSRCRPARRSRSSGRPARASRRSPGCSPGCSTRTPGA